MDEMMYTGESDEVGGLSMSIVHLDIDTVVGVLPHPKAMILEVNAVRLAIVLEHLLSCFETPTRSSLGCIHLVVVVASTRQEGTCNLSIRHIME